MTHRIAVLAGDGVGPEVVDEARRCVDELKLEIEWSDLDWGSDHWVEHGVMMPADAVEGLVPLDSLAPGAGWGAAPPLRPARAGRGRPPQPPPPRAARGSAAADPSASRPGGQRAS